MAGRNFLFVPGPTNVPDRIQRSMMVAMEDHRSPKFPELAKGLFPKLKQLYRCEDGEVYIFPTTGTGAWEAALTNTLSPGDRVLAPRFGQFSHLWIDMMQRLGLDVQVLECEWGDGAPEERIEQALREDRGHRIKGVMVVHNETATGVTSDLAAVRRAIDAARHPALFFVDSVSGLGSIDLRFTEWGIDLAVAGSQKGLMMPAGMGLVCVSPKAIEASKHAQMRRVFFDFNDMRKANADGYFPYTPSLPLLYGLRESLAMLFEEGLENVFERHARLAAGVRAAVHAWGMGICCRDERWYSDTVTAVVVPPHHDARRVIDIAFRRYDLALGAGLSKLSGRVFRIGHLGDLNELMLLGALAGVEMAMADAGIEVLAGSGVAAAQTHWRGASAHTHAHRTGAPQLAIVS
ncbi:MAG TPA: aminotransferase class V-fold PLP-dependent enzyme [Usitatibacter sp.]|nr:aminotransferase class V-fold PLP-dependent enzyme [Usitatibacter sp.]